MRRMRDKKKKESACPGLEKNVGRKMSRGDEYFVGDYCEEGRGRTGKDGEGRFTVNVADVYKFVIQGTSIRLQERRQRPAGDRDGDRMGVFSFRCKCARDARASQGRKGRKQGWEGEEEGKEKHNDQLAGALPIL